MHRKTLRTYLAGGLVALAAFTSSLAASSAEAQPVRGFTVNPDISDKDIQDLSAWNANVIRYPLHFGDAADSATAGQYLAWLDGALKKLDVVLESCRKRDIKVIVNLHTPPGGFKSIFTPALHRMFVEDWAYETFLETWQRIATRYEGDQAIWGYDILNEPAVRPGHPEYRSWASTATATAAVIHAIDSSARIIVEPVYGDSARMGSIRSLSFPGLVVSPHLYYPWSFHHQGLYGVPLGKSYPTKRFDKRSIVGHLQSLVRFYDRRKIPIYVGEFTAIRWAPNGSAFRYLRDLLPLMERRGWSWTYHSFREADPWNLEKSSKYGDTLPVFGDTDRLKLLKRYLRRNP